MADIKPLETDEQTVYYHHWTNDWVTAVVVKGVKEEHNDGKALTYNPPAPGTRHLRITLDPYRHYSAGTYGYRQNVEEGADVGQWQREAPRDWQKTKADLDLRAAIRREERLAQMSEASA